MPQEHNNSWGMVLRLEYGMNRNACKISTLGKIWEENISACAMLVSDHEPGGNMMQKYLTARNC